MNNNWFYSNEDSEYIDCNTLSNVLIPKIIDIDQFELAFNLGYRLLVKRSHKTCDPKYNRITYPHNKWYVNSMELWNHYLNYYNITCFSLEETIYEYNRSLL